MLGGSRRKGRARGVSGERSRSTEEKQEERVREARQEKDTGPRAGEAGITVPGALWGRTLVLTFWPEENSFSHKGRGVLET